MNPIGLTGECQASHLCRTLHIDGDWFRIGCSLVNMYLFIGGYGSWLDEKDRGREHARLNTRAARV